MELICVRACIHCDLLRRDTMTTTTNTLRVSDEEIPIQTRLILCRLRVCRYRIPAHGEVVCRLWRMTVSPTVRHNTVYPVYAVEMKGMGQRRMYTVGSEEAYARRLFELLVRHTVTPCALHDVLEEMG